MSKRLIFNRCKCLTFLILMLFFTNQLKAKPIINLASMTLQNQSNLTPRFIQNQGQYDKEVLYYAFDSKGEYWILDSSIWHLIQIPKSNVQVAIHIKFLNSNPNVKLVPSSKQASTVFNYLRGDSSQPNISKVPIYESIRFEDLYEGIDFELFGSESIFGVFDQDNSDALEGIDMIEIEIDGASNISLDGNQLSLSTDVGFLTMDSLFYRSPQDDLTVQTTIYTGINATVLTLPINYDSATLDSFEQPVNVISDSAVSYSTYLGGVADDIGFDISEDNEGNIYLTGSSESSTLPTSPGVVDNTYNGAIDSIIAKIDQNGQMVFVTYLGGSADEWGYGIDVDSFGNIHVVGETFSTDFPTIDNVFDETHNGNRDIFVAKVDPSGSNLIYSTFLGTSGEDYGRSIVVNQNGQAIISGAAHGGFPTTAGAYDRTNNGANDVIVTKLNSNGTDLIFSTFIGGASSDFGRAITINDKNDVFVTGYTKSNNFPTSSAAFDKMYHGEFDIFVSKLNSSGNVLEFSTYIGGSLDDDGHTIVVDDNDNVFVGGYTDSSNFPVTNGSFDSTFGGVRDGFIVKLNQNGSETEFATFLGGVENDFVGSLVLNSNGDLFATGDTSSPNFPTTQDSFDSSFAGNGDAYIAKLNNSGSTLLYSTFIGASGDEIAWGISGPINNTVAVIGRTSSTDFPNYERWS